MLFNMPKMRSSSMVEFGNMVSSCQVSMYRSALHMLSKCKDRSFQNRTLGLFAKIFKKISKNMSFVQ